tara:strand:- start:156 stop:302 length:147 start_codon:yes stop_codon:yes gene_type:complete
MKKDKTWMLITYYCPTHGDLGIIEPVELARDEISKTLSRKSKPHKSLD